MSAQYKWFDLQHTGSVTTGDVITVMPFGNEVDMIKVKGSNLRQQLEYAVEDYDPVDQHGKFLQFSGNNTTFTSANVPYKDILKISWEKYRDQT